jgi:RNA polymerase-binding protein DksA
MHESLTREQTEKLAAVLAERRTNLIHGIDTHFAQHAETRYTDLVGQVGDLEDHALAELLVDDELTGIQREIGELREVQAAEERLQRGACGTCSDCGGPIGFERLLAWPTATRCVPCQQAHEQTHVHPEHTTL